MQSHEDQLAQAFGVVPETPLENRAAIARYPDQHCAAEVPEEIKNDPLHKGGRWECSLAVGHPGPHQAFGSHLPDGKLYYSWDFQNGTLNYTR